ncbi:MAG: hypothetical protein ACT4N2_09560 [Hyphomicrobium sp.]
MRRATFTTLWLIATVAWVGVVSYFATTGWPRLPFDSGADAETAAALQTAVTSHVALHALAALVPPLVVILVARLFGGGRERPD